MNTKTKSLLALFLVCLIWGTTYLVNKLGVNLLPALFFTSIRQLVAGSILLAYFFLIKKEKWPSIQYFKFHFVIGIMLIGIGNGVGTFGLKYIESGISAILAAISPIVIALLTIFLKPEDKLDKKGWLGIVLGFSGILIICLDRYEHTQTAGTLFLGITLTIASVVAWGAGSVINKTKEFDTSPFVTAGFHMLFGGIVVFILSLIFEKPWQLTIPNSIYPIWAYLIVFGSIVAYSCYVYALKFLPATLVSIQSYVNPMIAIVLGVVFLHEKINTALIIGFFCTLLGVFLVNLSMLKRVRSIGKRIRRK